MDMKWALLVGVGAGVVYLKLARRQGRREPQAHALSLWVAAWIYVAFALLGGADLPHLALELAGVGAYGIFALLGLRYRTYWLAWGWLLHVLWDVGLHLTGMAATYVPLWYVYACLSFDVLVAGYLLMLDRRLNPAIPRQRAQ